MCKSVYLPSSRGGGSLKLVTKAFHGLCKNLLSDQSVRFGFTLAEVLITIGIIGIVAAMTLPSLISNYRKKQYVSQLKVAYSLLYSMSRDIMSESDTTSWKDTLLISELKENLGDIGNSNWSSQVKKPEYKDIVYKYLNKSMKIVQVSTCNGDECDYSYLNVPSQKGSHSGLYLFKLANGIVMEFRFFTEENSSNMGYVNVDVNGFKRPNQLGRDIFQFYFWDDGSVFPCGAQALAVKSTEKQDYWREDNSYAWSNCSVSKTSYGQGCTGRVLEEDAMLY